MPLPTVTPEPSVTEPIRFVPAGKGLFGDKATTCAGFAAAAAVDAAVTAPTFVPSVTFTLPIVAVPATKATDPPVLCIGAAPKAVCREAKAVLPVVCKAAVAAPVGKLIVPVMFVIDPMLFEPAFKPTEPIEAEPATKPTVPPVACITVDPTAV